MNFEEFKGAAIAYLSTHSDQTSHDVAGALCPSLNANEVSKWLKKMVDKGTLERKRDESYTPGIRYLYFVTESVKEKMEPSPVKAEVVPSFKTWDHALMEKVWGLVLQEMPTLLLRSSLKQYGRILEAKNIDFLGGTEAVIEITDESFLSMAEGALEYLKKAFAKVCGGRWTDYTISFVTPALNFGAEKVSKTTAPVIHSIPSEIKSEFSVKADGSTTVTLRGAARLLGISHPGLVKAFACNPNPSKLAQDLMGYGFEPVTFGSQGIPDKAFGIIVTYYAFKAGRYCTRQAQAVHDAFEAIGIRTWIQQELGWAPQAIVKAPDTTVTENLNALVASIQGLAASAQSQQAMIHDQQSALREVIAGLNHIGQSIHVHGQKIHEHESKIVEFDNYIQQQETLRKNAMKSVLGVKPTVEAPPKDPRAQLIHIVNNYVFAKGLGSDGHAKTWAHLYRDIELRCHVSLKAEQKKLIAAGKKDGEVRKIDAIESLGLMETAVAIACEVLGVA